MPPRTDCKRKLKKDFRFNLKFNVVRRNAGALAANEIAFDIEMSEAFESAFVYVQRKRFARLRFILKCGRIERVYDANVIGMEELVVQFPEAEHFAKRACFGGGQFIRGVKLKNLFFDGFDFFHGFSP